MYGVALRGWVLTVPAASHPLEPDRAEMEVMGRAALDLLVDFIDGLTDAPAVGTAKPDDLIAELLQSPPESPGELGPLLARFEEAAGCAIETAGPGFLGYIPGGGLFTSALAELLARGFNRYTAIPSFAPALVALEESTLRWLCQEFGLPSTAAGEITTGGSMATLTAVLAARDDRLGEDFLNGTIYVTAHTHQCVAKAARVAGLPSRRVRTVPNDVDLRMDPAAAASLIAQDRADGLRPFLMVATAGTTNTGAIDPLPELAELSQREGLWFHVDGAYGGFFQLTERGRARLAGVETADSLVLDPHKGLFLPYGTAVLLARDRSTLQAAFGTGTSSPYLQDVDESLGASLPTFADLGPDLTREFRGLRLWLPLHLHGLGAFRAALDEKLDLAEHAYRQLAADPRLEVPWKPELSTVAFRLPGSGSDRGPGGGGDHADDERNHRFLERILAANRVLLSSTRIDGWFTIRLSVLSHRTHRKHIDEALAIIRSAASDV